MQNCSSYMWHLSSFFKISDTYLQLLSSVGNYYSNHLQNEWHFVYPIPTYMIHLFNVWFPLRIMPYCKSYIRRTVGRPVWSHHTSIYRRGSLTRLSSFCRVMQLPQIMFITTCWYCCPVRVNYCRGSGASKPNCLVKVLKATGRN